SGSASPALIRGVSEYLAGRAGILHLGPFTAAEQAGLPLPTFLESLSRAANATELLNILQQPAPGAVDLRALWLRGGYPEPALLADPVQAWRWFDSYIRTLSERDLSAVARGLTPATLDRLLRMAAARHGHCLSIADFARDLGIAPRTAGAYLDVLEGAFLWR
ncbi:MAG: hypothetical protein AAB281_01900, partial [Actinomycetota bacterium]